MSGKEGKQYEEVSRIMRVPTRSRRGGDEGFALILAILALMLLTTLGLSLSVTTSTELQIATNYKWSQQALYNAEAGIEVGKALLSSGSWYGVLPARRAVTWNPNVDPTFRQAPAAVDPSAMRNFENGGCDIRGAGAGYGSVLVSNGTTWEDISTYNGYRLQGAFTLWVRRPIVMEQDGDRADYSEDDDTAIITAEGQAPFTGGGAGEAFVQENRATRVLEMMITRKARICGAGNTEQSNEGETNTRSAGCAPFANTGETDPNAL